MAESILARMPKPAPPKVVPATVDDSVHYKNNDYLLEHLILRWMNWKDDRYKEEKEEKTGKFVRRERYAGSMSRTFYVGEDIKQEDIHAKYESGVLRLSIPKPEERKA